MRKHVAPHRALRICLCVSLVLGSASALASDHGDAPTTVAQGKNTSEGPAGTAKQITREVATGAKAAAHATAEAARNVGHAVAGVAKSVGPRLREVSRDISKKLRSDGK
jgi:hypothetical protein